MNKVILIGNLGRDPEVRATPDGTMVVTLNLATSRVFKDKRSGEQKEDTQWHRVIYYGRLAEIAEKWLRKGRQVAVEGRLQTRKWQDKEGADHFATEIIGERLQLLGSKPAEAKAVATTVEEEDEIPF